jgi:GntR family transcriptional repressor for pyruvate dehydrogenase complex
MLSARGIISIEKGRGIFVNGFSSETVTHPMMTYLQFKGNDVLDVIKARLIIEPSIAEYAAMHRDEEDIQILMNDIDEMIRNQGHEKEHANLDLQFHLHVAAASKNHIMPLILQPIHKLMPKIKQRILSTVPNAFQSAVEWHSKIVEAIKNSDPEKAFQTMKKHLEIALEHTQQMLKTEEDEED